MIRLIDNYCAIPNNMGFTLAVNKGKTDKEGKPVYETIGYCGDIEEVLFLLKRKASSDRVSTRDMELSEALEVIKKTTDEIKEAIKGALT